MEFGDVKNSADLAKFLEDWVAFDGDGYGYDINGILAMLRACLRNLSIRAIEGDYENLDEIFESEEINVLTKLVAALQK